MGPLHQPLPEVGEELRANAVIGGRSAAKHANDAFLLCAGCLSHGFSFLVICQDAERPRFSRGGLMIAPADDGCNRLLCRRFRLSKEEHIDWLDNRPFTRPVAVPANGFEAAGQFVFS